METDSSRLPDAGNRAVYTSRRRYDPVVPYSASGFMISTYIIVKARLEVYHLIRPY